MVVTSPPMQFFALTAETKSNEVLIMYCSKCGTSIPDGAVYCPSCGHAASAGAAAISSGAHKLKAKNATRKWPLILILAIAIALFGLAIVLIVLSPSNTPNGNLFNNGLAIQINGKPYFSDIAFLYDDNPDSSLVQLTFSKDAFSKSVFSVGKYRGLCKYQDNIYCVQEFDTADGSWQHQMVCLDEKTNEKEVLFPDLTDVTICGVTDLGLFFTESNYEYGYYYNELYHMTENEELIEDKIYNPMFVSDRGVYVNCNPNTHDGLKIVSLDGMELKSFHSLRGFEVDTIAFEDNNYLYLMADDTGASSDIYRLDIENDLITNITESVFSQLGKGRLSLSGFTYSGDKLYYVLNSAEGTTDYSEVYTSDMMGNNVEFICRLPMSSNIWRLNFPDSRHLVLTNAWSYEWIVVDTKSGAVLDEK